VPGNGRTTDARGSDLRRGWDRDGVERLRTARPCRCCELRLGKNEMIEVRRHRNGWHRRTARSHEIAERRGHAIHRRRDRGTDRLRHAVFAVRRLTASLERAERAARHLNQLAQEQDETKEANEEARHTP